MNKKYYFIIFIFLLSQTISAKENIEGKKFYEMNYFSHFHYFNFINNTDYENIIEGRGPRIRRYGTYKIIKDKEINFIELNYKSESEEDEFNNPELKKEKLYFYNKDNIILLYNDKEITNMISGNKYILADLNFKASSVFIEDKKDPNRYSPYNLKHENLEEFWVEGKTDYGIGESITIDIEYAKPNNKKSGYDIKGIIIFNGSFKSEYLYNANSRVKEAVITFDNGYKKTIKLQDTRHPQVFFFENADGINNAVFKIESVYEGSKWKDTCITKIFFFSDDYESNY